jgi:hypothetical protein
MKYELKIQIKNENSNPALIWVTKILLAITKQKNQIKEL